MTLRSLILVFLSLRDLENGGYDWAAAQTCLREFFPQTPISASRRFKVGLGDSQEGDGGDGICGLSGQRHGIGGSQADGRCAI